MYNQRFLRIQQAFLYGATLILPALGSSRWILVAMNKHALSSIFIIAISATLSLIPPAVYAATPASLAVTPTPISGNPGDVFPVSIMLANAGQLAGYDVQLHFNGLSLQATSVDFSGPFAGTGCTLFVIQRSISNLAGLIRSAVSTFSGCTTPVSDLTTGPLAVFTVNFKVIARVNSPLHITTDSECACVGLATLSANGSPVAIPHTTSDGTFAAQPNIIFSQRTNVTASFDCNQCFGNNEVTLIAPLILPNTESLAGFAYVVFDVVTPSQRHLTVATQIVYLPVGSTITLTSKSASLTEAGVYQLYGTLYRSSDITGLVPFVTARGPSFNIAG
jgi:hypothetical protein